VVQTLLHGNLRPVLIDINPKSREFAEEMGLDIHLGDADREEILRHAGISNVCMAVVTVPDPRTSMRIIRMIRSLRPQLTIVARCRYNRYLADLQEAGADMVVDEETSMGEMLSRQIVEHLQESSGTILACRLGGQTPETAA
jgi:CPA2 family monovalent cation:H+ antiporter-2